MHALRGVLVVLPLLFASGCGSLLARDEAERGRFERDPAIFSPDTRGILVEVDWRRGREPDPGALELLARRLCERTGREVEFWRDDVLAPDGEALYDSRDVGAAMPGVAGLHVVYEARSPEGLRGLCRGREVFIYRDRVADHAMLWITATTIERTVLVHEAGHALGLSHCTRPDCVMYKPREGAVWDYRMVLANFWCALFLGRIPDDFCPLCVRDLAGEM